MTNAWLNTEETLSQAREYLALARFNKQAEQIHRDWPPQDEVDCYHLTEQADKHARLAAHYRWMAKQTLMELELFNGWCFQNGLIPYPLASYIGGANFQDWPEYKKQLEREYWPFAEDVWK